MKSLVKEFKATNKSMALEIRELKKQFKDSQRQLGGGGDYKIASKLYSSKYTIRLRYLVYALLRNKSLDATDKNWAEFTKLETLEAEVKRLTVEAANASVVENV